MKKYEVIIIGGSYAGLSAALTLGRSLRNTLVIDSELRCNNSAPMSHNFLTRDGQSPKEIHSKALQEIQSYPTVDFHTGYALGASKNGKDFKIKTWDGATFIAPKIIFATGLKDHLPGITGLKECWGISILHCPYCHGYEIKNKKTGILIDDPNKLEFLNLVTHWTKDIVIFTNGTSPIPEENNSLSIDGHVQIIDIPIKQLTHTAGKIKEVTFTDNTAVEIEAMYVRPETEQNCNIPAALGCNITDEGLIDVDTFQKTNIPGIFACGDNSNFGRSISLAVSSGTKAGMFVNRELLQEG